MIAEISAAGVGVLTVVIGGMALWVREQAREIADLRVQLAQGYHSKQEIDAIVARLTAAVAERIRAELMPVRFRLRDISRKLNLPPEIDQDDDE